jgi:hypothetical protein
MKYRLDGICATEDSMLLVARVRRHPDIEFLPSLFASEDAGML